MSYQQYRPLSPFELPLITKNLLLINVLLFVFTTYIIKPINLHHYLDLYYFTLPGFKPHQFITHMFMHADLRHLFFNMLGLYMFGSLLESVWGSKRFINFYLLCGIFAALSQLLFCYVSGQPAILLGASGAVSGLLGATGVLFPNREVYLYFFPVKVKYLVPFFFAVSWYSGYQSLTGDNTAHFAHVGGLVAGIIIVLIWNKTNRNTLY
ncbi:MAG: rhomboid family intramembrane serine protease [Bacteroidota bacterium]